MYRLYKDNNYSPCCYKKMEFLRDVQVEFLRHKHLHRFMDYGYMELPAHTAALPVKLDKAVTLSGNFYFLATESIHIFRVLDCLHQKARCQERHVCQKRPFPYNHINHSV